MRLRKLTLAVAALSLLAAASCEKDLESPTFENPLDPGYSGPELPATPVITSCTVGNRLVVVSWSVSDTTGIGSYRVYRSTGGSNQYDLVASTPGLVYSDQTVWNGLTYLYRVCSVTRDGREGKRSEAFECTPAPFSVTIEDGRRYATTRNVSLTFAAPPGTRSVLVSNTSAFSGSTWQPFSSSLGWQLEGGDGEKVVWARFRDAFALESVPVADSITLDTRSFVASLQWTPADSVHLPGASLTFRLDAGEARGDAWLSVGDVIETIQLFDDGSHGDGTPNDGRYETVYVLPPDLEFYKETVDGHFTDEAGNTAPAFVSQRLMTVAAQPAPVVLLVASARVEDSRVTVELAWTQNNDRDFASYRVYRDVSEVTLSSQLLVTLSGRTDTHFVDSTVVSSREYRYKVYVFDQLGLSSPSNEKRVTVP